MRLLVFARPTTWQIVVVLLPLEMLQSAFRCSCQTKRTLSELQRFSPLISHCLCSSVMCLAVLDQQ